MITEGMEDIIACASTTVTKSFLPASPEHWQVKSNFQGELIFKRGEWVGSRRVFHCVILVQVVQRGTMREIMRMDGSSKVSVQQELRSFSTFSGQNLR